jgi:hypothetical protein
MKKPKKVKAFYTKRKEKKKQLLKKISKAVPKKRSKK